MGERSKEVKVKVVWCELEGYRLSIANLRDIKCEIGKDMRCSQKYGWSYFNIGFIWQFKEF